MAKNNEDISEEAKKAFVPEPPVEEEADGANKI